MRNEFSPRAFEEQNGYAPDHSTIERWREHARREYLAEQALIHQQWLETVKNDDAPAEAFPG
jgi:hypothetical protein